jgi:hypothetical protein
MSEYVAIRVRKQSRVAFPSVDPAAVVDAPATRAATRGARERELRIRLQRATRKARRDRGRRAPNG